VIRLQTWTDIGACEASHADPRQLLRFDQLTPNAVCPEPTHPTEIDLNRPPREMASPPILNNRPLVYIATFRIHAILDAAMPKAFE
jgi:hypothetical protein